MKKNFAITIALIILGSGMIPNLSYANDESNNSDDLMQYVPTMENAFVGQKKISDEEFQKTLNEVKAKQNKKKKKKNQQVFPGKNFNDENSGSYIKETADKNLLLCLPVELTSVDGVDIPIGHYKILGERDKDKVYLDFYQSSTLIAKVPATETDYDFGEMAINFVKLVPFSERKVKILYGSMDFNAYTFVKIKPADAQN